VTSRPRPLGPGPLLRPRPLLRVRVKVSCHVFELGLGHMTCDAHVRVRVSVLV